MQLHSGCYAAHFIQRWSLSWWRPILHCVRVSICWFGGRSAGKRLQWILDTPRAVLLCLYAVATSSNERRRTVCRRIVLGFNDCAARNEEHKETRKCDSGKYHLMVVAAVSATHRPTITFTHHRNNDDAGNCVRFLCSGHFARALCSNF